MIDPHNMHSKICLSAEAVEFLGVESIASFELINQLWEKIEVTRTCVTCIVDIFQLI